VVNRKLLPVRRKAMPTHDYEERQKDVSDWGHHLDRWFASTAEAGKGEVSGEV